MWLEYIRVIARKKHVSTRLHHLDPMLSRPKSISNQDSWLWNSDRYFSNFGLISELPIPVWAIRLENSLQLIRLVNVKFGAKMIFTYQTNVIAMHFRKFGRTQIIIGLKLLWKLSFSNQLFPLNHDNFKQTIENTIQIVCMYNTW